MWKVSFGWGDRDSTAESRKEERITITQGLNALHILTFTWKKGNKVILMRQVMRGHFRTAVFIWNKWKIVNWHMVTNSVSTHRFNMKVFHERFFNTIVSLTRCTEPHTQIKEKCIYFSLTAKLDPRIQVWLFIDQNEIETKFWRMSFLPDDWSCHKRGWTQSFQNIVTNFLIKIHEDWDVPA